SALIVFVLFCPGPQGAIATSKDQQTGAIVEKQLKEIAEKDREEQAAIKAAMLAEIEAYLDQFKGTCFGKYISIGDIELFRAGAYKRLRLIVGKEGAKLVKARGKGEAYHESFSDSILYETVCNLALAFDPRDPKSHNTSNRRTMMHEMSHHLEWIAKVKTDEEPRANRNCYYQDHVITLLGDLAGIEKMIMERKFEPACNFTAWQKLSKELRELKENGTAAGGVVPDSNLSEITGFSFDVDIIIKAYREEKCNEGMKALALLPDNFSVSDEKEDECEKQKEAMREPDSPEKPTDVSVPPFDVEVGSYLDAVTLRNNTNRRISLTITEFIDNEQVRTFRRDLDHASIPSDFKFTPAGWEEQEFMQYRKDYVIPRTDRDGSHIYRFVIEPNDKSFPRIERTIEFSVKERVLNVARVRQEGNLWCWAASAQAILNYEGREISACELVNMARRAKLWPWQEDNVDCCTTGPKGEGCDPEVAGKSFYSTSTVEIMKKQGFSSDVSEGAMTADEVVQHIDMGKPFMIALKGHFIVARGYRQIFSGDESAQPKRLFLHVMDPLAYPHYLLINYAAISTPGGNYLGLPMPWVANIENIMAETPIIDESGWIDAPDRAIQGIPFEARIQGLKDPALFVEWISASPNVQKQGEQENGRVAEWSGSVPGMALISANVYSDSSKSRLISAKSPKQVAILPPPVLELQAYGYPIQNQPIIFEKDHEQYGKPRRLIIRMKNQRDKSSQSKPYDCDVEKMNLIIRWHCSDSKNNDVPLRRDDDLSASAIKDGRHFSMFNPPAGNGEYAFYGTLENVSGDIIATSNTVTIIYVSSQEMGKFQNLLDKGAKIISERPSLLLGKDSGLELQFTDKALKEDSRKGLISIKWSASSPGDFRPSNRGFKTRYTARMPGKVTITATIEKAGQRKLSGFLTAVLPVNVPEDFLVLTLSPSRPKAGDVGKANADIPREFYYGKEFHYSWRCENCRIEYVDRPATSFIASKAGTAAVIVELLVDDGNGQLISLITKKESFKVDQAAKKPADKPDTTKPADKPITTKPEDKPVITKPADKPTTTKPADKPTTTKPEDKPTTTKPEDTDTSGSCASPKFSGSAPDIWSGGNSNRGFRMERKTAESTGNSVTASLSLSIPSFSPSEDKLLELEKEMKEGKTGGVQNDMATGLELWTGKGVDALVISDFKGRLIDFGMWFKRNYSHSEGRAGSYF
ncbi:MAG: C39 family peptidase, partial [Deltaproteobacteria bacterium]